MDTECLIDHYETEPIFAYAIKAHNLNLSRLDWEKETNPRQGEQAQLRVKSERKVGAFRSELILYQNGGGMLTWRVEDFCVCYILSEMRLIILAGQLLSEALITTLSDRHLNEVVEIDGAENMIIINACNFTAYGENSVFIGIEPKTS